MIELAINTKTADSTMGSQSAASETMRTSLLFELWRKGGQTGFGSRGYSTPVFRSSFLEGGIPAAALGGQPVIPRRLSPEKPLFPFDFKLFLNYPRTPTPPLPESLSPLRCTKTKSPARCLPA